METEERAAEKDEKQTGRRGPDCAGRVSQERGRGHVPQCWEEVKDVPWLSKQKSLGELARADEVEGWVWRPHGRGVASEHRQ